MPKPTWVIIDTLPGGRKIIRASGLDQPRNPKTFLGDGPLWAAQFVQHAALAHAGFREVAPHGPQTGNLAGGDSQYGETYSRRFARALVDGNWAVIDVTYYVAYDHAKHEFDAPGELRLDREIGWTVCRDLNSVGDTEEYADYSYDTIETEMPKTDDSARQLCEDIDQDEFAFWVGQDIVHGSDVYKA